MSKIITNVKQLEYMNLTPYTSSIFMSFCIESFSGGLNNLGINGNGMLSRNYS